jgi:cholesterol oxidase
MLGAVRYPYMPTDVDRVMRQVAIEMGRGETFNKAPVGVYFGSRASRPTIRTSAGLDRGAPAASLRQVQHRLRPQRQEQADDERPLPGGKLGVEVHQLHEVYDLVPLDGGGFEVHTRYPGWAQRAAHLHHHTYIAEQVIVAAHAYGSAKLLLHMQHEGRLPGLPSELGQRARRCRPLPAHVR